MIGSDMPPGSHLGSSASWELTRSACRQVNLIAFGSAAGGLSGTTTFYRRKKRGALRLPLQIYIIGRGLRQGSRCELGSPPCRWGRSPKAHQTMRNDEWVPVFHENCDRVDGPFYHGTRADLSVGDLLTAGFKSNYDDRVVMNHVYFTTLSKGAGLAAEMARGAGRPRVYVVAPTGTFEDDPNVTNKKFPGNPTRSYRSDSPLRIVDELENWEAYDAEFIRELRYRVEAGMGEIIN